MARETIERWPLLSVETEINGDTKSANERGLPWLVPWACRTSPRDFCFALAALYSPVQNMFFLTNTISIPLFPSPRKPGRQPYWVACLLVCVSWLGANGFMKKTKSRKSWDTVPLILSWCRKKCNPSWFTDLMMKNKVAVLNQGTKSKICTLFIFKAWVWCSSVVKARLLSARKVLGSFPGWAVDK